MKIIFILQYDSFVNTMIPVIKYLRSKDIQCTILLLKPWYKRNWINNKIIKTLDGSTYSTIYTINSLYKYFKTGYDVCVFATIGQQFILQASQYLKNHNYKTKIVTGYIGITLNNNDDIFFKGIRRRSLSDMIFVPGGKTKNEIIQSGIINNIEDKIKITGLPRFENIYLVKKSNKPTNKILFIEQANYPESKIDRYNLVENLIQYAIRYPKKTVIIKPRFEEHTGHADRPKFLLQDIIKKLDHPKNIIIKYDDLYDIFRIVDLALTISSTAGLETLYLKIPTYFIKDYCEGRNKYGTDYFHDLNAVVSFSQILKNKFPKINFNKVNDYIDFKASSSKNLGDQLIKLNELN